MELTLNSFKTTLEYLLDNNKRLTEENKRSISIGIEGECGIGKTQLIEQVAKKRGMTLCKINLAQLEEVGDLTGLPTKEYKFKDELGRIQWLPADLIRDCAFEYTGENRMSYAIPAWLPSEENENGTILFLDDWSRANPMIIQAVMEIINEGKYISWKLPKNTTIILSSNPENGQYNVSSLDDAVKTRFLNFNVKFNLNEWARWAEEAELDGRAINFALLYSKEIFEMTNGVRIANARNYTLFCNAIKGIKDWNTPESLELITKISHGCFFDNSGTVGTLFAMFIANKLDKLVQPEDMLFKNWKDVSKEIKACIYDNNSYRADIASLLSTRLLNYILTYFSKNGSKSNLVQDRLLEFIENPDKLFTEDSLFNIIKNICITYPRYSTKLLSNSKIRSKII